MRSSSDPCSSSSESQHPTPWHCHPCYSASRRPLATAKVAGLLHFSFCSHQLAILISRAQSTTGKKVAHLLLLWSVTSIGAPCSWPTQPRMALLGTWPSCQAPLLHVENTHIRWCEAFWIRKRKSCLSIQNYKVVKFSGPPLIYAGSICIVGSSLTNVACYQGSFHIT